MLRDTDRNLVCICFITSCVLIGDCWSSPLTPEWHEEYEHHGSSQGMFSHTVMSQICSVSQLDLHIFKNTTNLVENKTQLIVLLIHHGMYHFVEYELDQNTFELRRKPDSDYIHTAMYPDFPLSTYDAIINQAANFDGYYWFNIGDDDVMLYYRGDPKKPSTFRRTKARVVKPRIKLFSEIYHKWAIIVTTDDLPYQSVLIRLYRYQMDHEMRWYRNLEETTWLPNVTGTHFLDANSMVMLDHSDATEHIDLLLVNSRHVTLMRVSVPSIDTAESFRVVMTIDLKTFLHCDRSSGHLGKSGPNEKEISHMDEIAEPGFEDDRSAFETLLNDSYATNSTDTLEADNSSLVLSSSVRSRKKSQSFQILSNAWIGFFVIMVCVICSFVFVYVKVTCDTDGRERFVIFIRNMSGLPCTDTSDGDQKI
ncbi:hypothetical protein HDE_13220 [Halotydeus destructor]|nr:hypothetical protein HDE_13220 [Halotydeus destructor]